MTRDSSDSCAYDGSVSRVLGGGDGVLLLSSFPSLGNPLVLAENFTSEESAFHELIQRIEKEKGSKLTRYFQMHHL